VTQNVVWYVVKTARSVLGSKSWPHTICAEVALACAHAGGEIEQIQFLLGHASVQILSATLDASKVGSSGYYPDEALELNLYELVASTEERFRHQND